MKLKPPILKSERLILRPFKQSDAKDLLEINYNKVKNLNEAKKWIKNSITKDSFYLAVVLKEENKVIGYRELCHLKWWDFQAGEICAHFNKKYWNKGYSTESGKALINYCFKKLKFHKVYADTDPDNKASQRVLQKLGFKLEGRIRDKRIVKGNWIDEMDYGLLRSEWGK
jgi:[ribosomal protein S5]-alanine N-acetyltransferase